MRPRYLYHLSYRRDRASIEEQGFVPRLATDFKELLPRDLQVVPVVWFTGDVRARGNYIHPTRQVIAVPLVSLDLAKLYKLYLLEVDGLRGCNWWVYTDMVSPAALVFGSIAEIRALEGIGGELATV